MKLENGMSFVNFLIPQFCLLKSEKYNAGRASDRSLNLHLFPEWVYKDSYVNWQKRGRKYLYFLAVPKA